MRKNYPPENKDGQPEDDPHAKPMSCVFCGQPIDESENVRRYEPADDRARAFEAATGRKQYVHDRCAKSLRDPENRP